MENKLCKYGRKQVLFSHDMHICGLDISIYGLNQYQVRSIISEDQ